jgi:hypothetical protein
MFNPYQMIQAARMGRNPMEILQQMAAGNPAAGSLLQSIRGKNPAELQQMAANLARERGTDLQTVANMLGITIPKTGV